VIRIAISVEALEAIASMLPFGSVAVEPELDTKGERDVWLEPNVVNRLRHARAGGELQQGHLAHRSLDLNA
jgi:hypothetical protein